MKKVCKVLGGLAAVGTGYILYKNRDSVREYGTEVKDKVQTKVEDIKVKVEDNNNNNK